MKLIKIIPSGYCKGVVRAINIAKNTAISNPDKQIYILGMIVHNSYVTQALNHYNIITLSDPFKTKYQLLDEIKEGIVIFTAHGISDDIVSYAKARGLETIDATCPDVLVTKSNITEKLSQGYNVLYIGKAKHPEAEAIISISDRIHLITSADDLEEIDRNLEKVYVTNQTTMSIYEIDDIFRQIRNIFPDAYFEEEICNATRKRQEAVIENSNVDLLYVVGDVKSNNSNKLKDIALKNNVKNAYLIASAEGIKPEHLENVNSVAVTAGASTPTYLTNQVVDTLNRYIETSQLNIPEIITEDIL